MAFQILQYEKSNLKKMAIHDFEENIVFLKERWNDKIMVNFLEKTKTVIVLIKRNPFATLLEQFQKTVLV